MRQEVIARNAWRAGPPPFDGAPVRESAVKTRDSRMPTNPPARKGPRTPPVRDRRAAATADGNSGPLRGLKSILGRPIALERRDGRLHVVLAERRRAAPLDQAPSPSQLCEELSARLLAHDPEHLDQKMRPLLLVHEALGRKGWPGVAALPGPVLSQALAQAEVLADGGSSLRMETLIEGLRPLAGAADLRDERLAREQDFKIGETVEVSESSYAEFDRLERSWVGTTPSDLPRPERDDNK
jgi:hypothetical protein